MPREVCPGSKLPPAMRWKHWHRCGFCGRDFAPKLDGTVRRHVLSEAPVTHKTNRPQGPRA